MILYRHSFKDLLELLKTKGKETGFITYDNYKNKLKGLNISIKYLADSEKSVEQSNKNLYNILREFDEENIKEIYILPIKENKENVALLNRLNKAISKK